MTGYVPYTRERCHTGPIEVMKIGKTNIWAGKWAEMDWDLDWSLRIRFVDEFTRRSVSPFLLSADESARSMLGPELFAVKYPPTVNIDWPDFDVPALSGEWWKMLVEKLKAMGPANVAVYCYGGHGRTGTALSILAGLGGIKPKKGEDIVSWVRKKYCKEAVESTIQIEYIEDVTGLSLKSRSTSVLNLMKPKIMNGGYSQTFVPNSNGLYVPQEGSKDVEFETYVEDPESEGYYGMEDEEADINPDTTMFDPKNTVQSSSARELMVALNKRGGSK